MRWKRYSYRISIIYGVWNPVNYPLQNDGISSTFRALNRVTTAAEMAPAECRDFVRATDAAVRLFEFRNTLGEISGFCFFGKTQKSDSARLCTLPHSPKAGEILPAILTPKTVPEKSGIRVELLRTASLQGGKKPGKTDPFRPVFLEKWLGERMAFKRSAVRSRLSPPSPESEARNSFLKGNEFFVLWWIILSSATI